MNDLESWGRDLAPDVAARVAAVEGAVEAIVALSGGIAHDFSNVFQALVFALQATTAEVPEGSALREQLSDVRSGSDRGVRLLRSLARLGSRPSAVRQLVFPHDAIPALAPNLRRALALVDPIEVDVHGASAAVHISPAALDGALLVACLAVHQYAAGPVRIDVQESGDRVAVIVSGAPGRGSLGAVEAVFAEREPMVGPRVTLIRARLLEAGAILRVEAAEGGGARLVIDLPRYVTGPRG